MTIGDLLGELEFDAKKLKRIYSASAIKSPTKPNTYRAVRQP
jgi:hypothetical protein